MRVNFFSGAVFAVIAATAPETANGTWLLMNGQYYVHDEVQPGMALAQIDSVSDLVIQAPIDTKAKPDSHTNLQPEANADANANTSTSVHAEGGADANAETGVKAKAKADIQAIAEACIKAISNIGSEAHIDTKS